MTAVRLAMAAPCASWRRAPSRPSGASRAGPTEVGGDGGEDDGDDGGEVTVMVRSGQRRRRRPPSGRHVALPQEPRRADARRDDTAGRRQHTSAVSQRHDDASCMVEKDISNGYGGDGRVGRPSAARAGAAGGSRQGARPRRQCRRGLRSSSTPSSAACTQRGAGVGCGDGDTDGSGPARTVAAAALQPSRHAAAKASNTRGSPWVPRAAARAAARHGASITRVSKSTTG